MYGHTSNESRVYNQGCIYYIVSLSLGYIQGEHWQLKPGLQPTMDSIPGQQLLAFTLTQHHCLTIVKSACSNSEEQSPSTVCTYYNPTLVRYPCLRG